MGAHFCSPVEPIAREASDFGHRKDTAEVRGDGGRVLWREHARDANAFDGDFLTVDDESTDAAAGAGCHVDQGGGAETSVFEESVFLLIVQNPVDERVSVELPCGDCFRHQASPEELPGSEIELHGKKAFFGGQHIFSPSWVIALECLISVCEGEVSP